VEELLDYFSSLLNRRWVLTPIDVLDRFLGSLANRTVIRFPIVFAILVVGVPQAMAQLHDGDTMGARDAT
jgi:hypothetical protein